MAYWTLQQVQDKINKELDLENEELIQPTEFVGYVNDAVREVVAEMIKLSVEDTYFQKYASFPIVANTSDYALPSDIFGNKIKALVFNDGTNIYRVKRIRGENIYTMLEYFNQYNTGDSRPIRYALFNASRSAGYSLKVLPQPKSNFTLTMYYVRQAEELSLTDDGTGLVDCPEEFIQFLVAFVKVKCLAKEIGNPNLQMAMSDEDRCRKLMVQTLTDQVEDSDNTIPLDLSHYEEST